MLGFCNVGTREDEGSERGQSIGRYEEFLPKVTGGSGDELSYRCS